MSDTPSPNGPYDPQPNPTSPDPAPVLPGHTPTEVPVREPVGIPAIDPDRSPGTREPIGVPGSTPTEIPVTPSEPGPRA